MPLYDYECPKCGNIQENVLQKFDDPPLVCDHSFEGIPGEGEPATMNRLIGQVSFRQVGKDWPDVEHKKLKERFEKRNKRIEKMSPQQQEAFKRIIDSTGGKRYIP